MTSNRVVFASAIGLAVLALFMLNGVQAAEFGDTQSIVPNDSRVDGNEPINFIVDFSDGGDEVTNLVIKVWIKEVDMDIELTCDSGSDPANCEGGSVNGDYTITDATNRPEARTLVSSVGDDEIAFGFIATFTIGNGDDEEDVERHWPGMGDNCIPGDGCPSVRVNTLPILTDNAAVSGGGMPEDDYTLTITYTDADDHEGTLTATVCDTEASPCEDVILEKGGSDFIGGVVYSVVFNTNLGGVLTVTVSGTDSYDSAADRTTTFTVDTETPWLKNPSVSPGSGGEDDDFTFSIVYCVFDDTTGTPSVNVEVGAWGDNEMDVGTDNPDACLNGVNYSLVSAVPWANTEQAITFKASNDEESAVNVAGSSITVNDAPTLTTGSAERHFNGVDFVFNATATDANLNDGDTFKVYVTIEADSEREMTCDGAGDCTLTVAEADIIDQLGGTRLVSFRVQDDTWGAENSDGFSQTIFVTQTSSFGWVAPTDASFLPGPNGYDFTITNNGNSEDTFTVTATSDNGWVASGSESQTVTVGKDATETFTITMDVAHVDAGIVDHWSASVTAGNDDTQTGSHDGQTTVASVSGHTVSIGTNSGSALPGSSVSYSFVITNTGNTDADFTYSTDSASDWGLAGGAGDISNLASGASATVTVIHTVGEDASSEESDVITFTATADEDSSSQSATATTTAEQTYGATIALGTSNQPSTLNPGASFTVSYTVTNTGNGVDDFSVFFDAAWMSDSSSTSLSNLAGGASGTSTLTITVPADAASGSSSTATANVAGGGDSSDSYGATTFTVADNTRSATVDTDNSYSHNEGGSTSGTVTVTNTGVTSGFAVIAMDDALSFDTSVILLGAGQSGTLSFTVHAAATGDVSFTVSDAVDEIVIQHTFGVTVNTFDTLLLTTDTGDCDDVDITCDTDAAGGFASGVYTKAGTWHTTMTATDSNGMTNSHTFTTTIDNVAPSVAAPTAPADTIAQSEQSFSFTVPEDTDGTITQFVIDFGDGNSFTFNSSELDGRNAVAVTHTYALDGEYTITATAYDNSGSNTIQTTTIEVGDSTVTMGDNSYLYNFVALVGFALLGIVLSATSLRMSQGVIAGDEEMNDRDRQRLESVERRMESLSEREELLEVSAYDASRAATKLEEHLTAFNEILVKAQEIAAEEKLKELEAAEETKAKEEEQMQLDLEDPDIEMVAERFHDALGRLVDARGELSKIEEQLAHILKMERDEQLEKLTEMSESYETTKRKIDALETSAEARDAAAVENNIMNLLSAAASGGSVGGADFGDFDDGDEEFEVEIYEDVEDGSFYYIDPDTGEETPCDEDGNAL